MIGGGIGGGDGDAGAEEDGRDELISPPGEFFIAKGEDPGGFGAGEEEGRDPVLGTVPL